MILAKLTVKHAVKAITRQEKKDRVSICRMILFTVQSTQPAPTLSEETEEQIGLVRFLVLERKLFFH
ncbi:hypothetical protein MANES_02G061850v8 [Manihot esculenta]|uniref:Uncharacterized protein n=1 Tax=Manihot esculenta TaxID=3983 RepID=A0ACB7I5B0_MANES|nr:hypothetical protein MANES_02G061850v8 [Manihot esculenta]